MNTDGVNLGNLRSTARLLQIVFAHVNLKCTHHTFSALQVQVYRNAVPDNSDLIGTTTSISDKNQEWLFLDIYAESKIALTLLHFYVTSSLLVDVYNLSNNLSHSCAHSKKRYEF